MLGRRRFFGPALLDEGIGNLEHAFVAAGTLPIGAESTIDDERRDAPSLVGLGAALRLVDGTADPKGLEGLQEVVGRGAGRAGHRGFLNLIGKEACDGLLAAQGLALKVKRPEQGRMGGGKHLARARDVIGLGEELVEGG